MAQAPPDAARFRVLRSVRRWGAKALHSEIAWISFALAVAAGRAFSTRHQLNPDGLNYIDLAQSALLHGPAELVNGYWSPGYPALIATLFWVVKPDAAHEFPVAHALNFLVFIFVCWAGRAFIRAECTAFRTDGDRFLMPVAWALLVTVAIYGVGVGLVTPDLAVMGLVLATACCFRRVEIGAQGTRWALLLGATAGLAYWMKAVMLPLGAALLVLLWLNTARAGRGWRVPAIASISWLVVVLPLVLLLSAKAGHASFGAAGKLAWAWNVGQAPFYPGWTDPRHGVPVNQPRVLLAQPRALEFAAPVNGTYPFSYDPTYWYQGLVTRLELRAQLDAFGRAFDEYARWFIHRPVILVLLVCLGAGVRVRRGGYRTPFDPWSLSAWSFIALALYAAVLVESRYVAPFAFLLLVAAARELMRYGEARSTRFVATAFAVLVAALGIRDLGRQLLRPTTATPPYLAIARELERAGVRAGDQVGVVGEVLPADWARAARVRVTSQLIVADEAAALDGAAMQVVREKFASTGARALVSRDAPVDFAGPDWRYFPLSDGTRFALLWLGR